MEWTTALPDWERRIVAAESLIAFPPLFPAEAADALEVFSALKVVDMGAGGQAPTMGEVSRPWVNEFVGAIFGAYDPDEGRRLITEFMLCISKKNTKSTTAAGIMLTALVRNWRQSGEFLILAPTKEIADNSFAPARDMVMHDAVLSALLHVQPNIRQITHRDTEATLKVVAADSDTVGGKKAIGVLIDELWLFGKQPNAENMLREATGGQASRPEGFTIYLSTQSDAPPAGVFEQKLQYARGVRDGRIQDKRFLPVLYEFPQAMIDSKAYEDPKNFYITNPNLGASVDVEYIERKHAQAIEEGKTSLPGFYAKHLNIQIGMALRSDRWSGAEFWNDQADRTLTLEELLRRSEVVTVGIDGGGLDDLLGLAVIGREKETERWLVWTHAWAHPVAIERRKSEATKYADFESDGDLTIIESLPGDVSQVAQKVVQVKNSGRMASIGMDPEKTHKVMLQALVDAKVDEKLCFGISQGWRLVGAITVAERKLAEKKMVHGGQRLMAWCVGNAKVEPRGNAALITKQASGTAKIDPLMALFNAVSLMSLNPKASGAKHQFFTIG